MERFLIILAAGQAIYYGVTGVWPLISMRTFLMVTGPKTDLWLVKTVALLITAVAMTLGVGAIRGRIGVELAILALTSCASLAAIDMVYVAKRVIAKIYLADAAAEIALIIAWLSCWRVWANA